MRTRFTIVCATLFAGLAGLAGAAAAQYPERPITMVVPGPPGAGTDVPARMVVQALAARLKQSIVVDNRAAASGTQGTLQVLASKPDGYTLLFANGTVLGIAPSLFPQLTIDDAMRFTPIGFVGHAPMILLVPVASPIRSVKDLVDAARAQPGKLNLAHGGNGTPHHLSGEMFKQATGVDMVSVPYKGAVAALTAIAAGQVDASFDGPSAVPFVKNGRLRALAVAGARRHIGLPDVPTLGEVGYPEVQLSGWYGITAPPGTPEAIVARLNTELNAVLESDEVKAGFAKLGLQAQGGTPEEFRKYYATDLQRMAAIVKSAKVKAD